MSEEVSLHRARWLAFERSKLRCSKSSGDEFRQDAGDREGSLAAHMMEHWAEFQESPSPQQRSYPTRKFEVVWIAIWKMLLNQTTRSLRSQDRSLILFPQSLGVRFTVRVEEFLAPLLPRRFEFGCCDVPVRPAFPGNGTEVLAEFLESGPPEKPIAVVDFINDKARFEDNHVGDHRIVERIGVLGDVEVFLDQAPRVGEERPVRVHSASIFVGLRDVVGADGDQTAIANLQRRRRAMENARSSGSGESAT